MQLSVIIPSRNEEFLQRTVKDVLENSGNFTEVIVILDGQDPSTFSLVHERIRVIHNQIAIGQRAATNQGVKASSAKFIMKLDAHCSMGKGFDEILMKNCEYNWVVLPRMFVLDAFHWKCLECGKEINQGPLPEKCNNCNGIKFDRRIIWLPKKRKRTDYMFFNNDLRVKYFDSNGLSEYPDIPAAKKKFSHKYRDWAKGDITDVMCGVGACWFLHRNFYWELGGLDENHGSWGQMAVEIAMKTWLYGGRHIVNKKTWFAHLFRTKKGFSWPYDNPARAQEKCRQYSKGLWLNNKWGKQKHRLSWLIDKFQPVPTWEEYKEDMNDITIILYGLTKPNQKVRDQLNFASKDIPIIEYEGDELSRDTKNILEKVTTKYVAFCDTNTLYVPEHFKYRPSKHHIAVNYNVWNLNFHEHKYYHFGIPWLCQCIAERDYLMQISLPTHFSNIDHDVIKTEEPNVVVAIIETKTDDKIQNFLLPWGNAKELSLKLGLIDNNIVSIIIVGRCEPYFQKTINSCLEQARGNIEIVAIVDGEIPDPLIQSTDRRVRIFYNQRVLGQRASYNKGVRFSIGKYLLKLDAHALLSEGFDVQLKKDYEEKTVVIPWQDKLDVKHWRPTEAYQNFLYFDKETKYHEYSWNASNPENATMVTGQGSCWFVSKKWNDYIELLDENVGSWGCTGIEVSLKTWLCGGKLIRNKNVHHAHWFRKNEGGHTYPKDGRNVKAAIQYVKNNYFYNDHAFKNQIKPFNWLIDKFNLSGWEEKKSNRFIVYYTDSKIDETLASAVRKKIKKIADLYNIDIISVSQKPLDFGKNICVGEKPYSYVSMYEQILAGLKEVPLNSIVNLCEHDVFYHESHFKILPEDKEHMFFNTNRYYWKQGMDYFFPARGEHALSQGVAYREFILRHVTDRLEEWGKVPNAPLHIATINFKSDRPNVDIRHNNNFTPDGKYKKEYMKGKKQGIYNLPGWGSPEHFMKKTGYIRPLDVGSYLHKKYNKGSLQCSPVRIRQFQREKLAKLFNSLGYIKGAEIGVRTGTYSIELCQGIPGLELYCIDPWYAFGRATSQEKADIHYQKAQERLKGHNVIFKKGFSMDIVKEFKENSLDFVYIDGNHTFDYVMQDLIEWTKIVKKGGIISGHDYYRWRYGQVVPAVDAYTYAHQIKEWFLTDDRTPSFFWVKE